jgi:hypothetical protein
LIGGFAAASPNIRAKFRLRFQGMTDMTKLPKLTIIATGATPDDEREFGVEGGGKRSRKFLAA